MRKLSTNKVCDMAEAFKGVTRKDHHGGDAFVANGRIFATVWHNKNQVNLMLNESQQKEILERDDSEGFFPIENSWGKNAISVDLKFVDSQVFTEALKAAYESSTQKRANLNSKAKVK